MLRFDNVSPLDWMRAFKADPQAVTQRLIAPASSPKEAWEVLEALDTGFLSKAQPDNAALHATLQRIPLLGYVGWDQKLRRKLVEKGFFEADGSYPLTQNALVKETLDEPVFPLSEKESDPEGAARHTFTVHRKMQAFLDKATPFARQFVLSQFGWIRHPDILYAITEKHFEARFASSDQREEALKEASALFSAFLRKEKKAHRDYQSGVSMALFFLHTQQDVILSSRELYQSLEKAMMQLLQHDTPLNLSRFFGQWTPEQREKATMHCPDSYLIPLAVLSEPTLVNALAITQQTAYLAQLPMQSLSLERIALLAKPIRIRYLNEHLTDWVADKAVLGGKGTERERNQRLLHYGSAFGHDFMLSDRKQVTSFSGQLLIFANNPDKGMKYMLQDRKRVLRLLIELESGFLKYPFSERHEKKYRHEERMMQELHQCLEAQPLLDRFSRKKKRRRQLVEAIFSGDESDTVELAQLRSSRFFLKTISSLKINREPSAQAFLEAATPTVLTELVLKNPQAIHCLSEKPYQRLFSRDWTQLDYALEQCAEKNISLMTLHQAITDLLQPEKQKEDQQAGFALLKCFPRFMERYPAMKETSDDVIASFVTVCLLYQTRYGEVYPVYATHPLVKALGDRDGDANANAIRRKILCQVMARDTDLLDRYLQTAHYPVADSLFFRRWGAVALLSGMCLLGWSGVMFGMMGMLLVYGIKKGFDKVAGDRLRSARDALQKQLYQAMGYDTSMTEAQKNHVILTEVLSQLSLHQFNALFIETNAKENNVITERAHRLAQMLLSLEAKGLTLDASSTFPSDRTRAMFYQAKVIQKHYQYSQQTFWDSVIDQISFTFLWMMTSPSYLFGGNAFEPPWVIALRYQKMLEEAEKEKMPPISLAIDNTAASKAARPAGLDLFHLLTSENKKPHEHKAKVTQRTRAASMAQGSVSVSPLCGKNSLRKSASQNDIVLSKAFHKKC